MNPSIHESIHPSNTPLLSLRFRCVSLTSNSKSSLAPKQQNQNMNTLIKFLHQPKINPALKLLAPAMSPGQVSSSNYYNPPPDEAMTRYERKRITDVRWAGTHG